MDALKDTQVELAEEEGGMAIASAMQRCVSEGVEVLANHHHRKSQQGGSAPKYLDDVYGSAWITAGAGSLITLWGKPGRNPRQGTPFWSATRGAGCGRRVRRLHSWARTSYTTGILRSVLSATCPVAGTSQ